METNKLLTLEDIEKIEASIDQYGYTNEEIFSLAATARAYWEMKKKEVHVSCGQCGLTTCVEVEAPDENGGYEDK